MNITGPVDDSPPRVTDRRVAVTMWVGGVLGTVGCALNILVFLSFNQAERKTASIFLYQLLAVFDGAAALLDGTVQMLLTQVTGFEMMNFGGRGFCKMFRYLDGTTNVIAFLLVAGLALDRMVAVRCPFWHQNHSTSRHGVIYGSAVVSLGMLMESPLLYFSEHELGKCTYLAKTLSDNQFRLYLFGYRMLSLHLLIPCSLIVLCGGLLVTKLAADNPKPTPQLYQVKSSEQVRRERFEQGQRRMLVLLLCAFLVFVIPSLSLMMVSWEVEDERFYHNIGETGLVLQHSVNILLYLSSGPVFRSMVCRALTCHRRS